jgi:hypothetical protein
MCISIAAKAVDSSAADVILLNITAEVAAHRYQRLREGGQAMLKGVGVCW